jgi:hypothetical protein
MPDPYSLKDALLAQAGDCALAYRKQVGDLFRPKQVRDVLSPLGGAY